MRAARGAPAGAGLCLWRAPGPMGARRGEGRANGRAGGGAARRGRGCPGPATCARRRHPGAAPGALPGSPPFHPSSPGASAAVRSRAVLGPWVGRAPTGREAAGGSRGAARRHPPRWGLLGAAQPVGRVVPPPFTPAGLTLTGNGAGPPAGLQAVGSRAAGNECFARKTKGAAIFFRFCQTASLSRPLGRRWRPRGWASCLRGGAVLCNGNAGGR